MTDVKLSYDLLKSDGGDLQQQADALRDISDMRAFFEADDEDRDIALALQISAQDEQDAQLARALEAADKVAQEAEDLRIAQGIAGTG
jgi:hypothetical protein